MIRNIISISIFFTLTLAVAQKTEFGKLTPSELNFKSYDQDTTASAVYLFEYGDNYFDIRNDRIWLITEYHAKIKILKKEGIKKASIEIPYYHNGSNAELVRKIRGITHNGTVKHGIKANDDVFIVDESERWSTKRFTFPNVQVGSIIEYTYEVQSPFFFNLNGWSFQDNIPKLYTEYNAKIPGNWIYNRTLIGELKLDVNSSTIQKECFQVPGIPNSAACEVLKYAMNNVPAFKDSEEFMLAPRNYRSKLKFELATYHSFSGKKKQYTRTWNDVDKEFRFDKDLGRQLKKNNFFEDKVPTDLLTQGSQLEKAKNIYNYVQNHFNWNGNYGIWHNNRVKKAFEEKVGNIAEINITLINLLNSAGIDTKMVLSATRQFGLPKMSHPVMSDFNYVMAQATIDGNPILLDATDKNIPFGVLPFRALNYNARVMDFKDKSYWTEINPNPVNRHIVRANMKVNVEENKLEGVFNSINIGYDCYEHKKKLLSLTENEYLDQLEDNSLSDFEITSYELVENQSDEDKIIQKFEFEIAEVGASDQILINPFVVAFFDSNPFKSDERNYPVDFGYPRNYSYNLNLAIPEGYKVKELPKEISDILPGNLGMLKFRAIDNGNNTTALIFDLKLNATHYPSKIYKNLKDFFAKAVTTQTQTYIVLEKV